MKECPRCKHFRLYDCRCILFQCAQPWKGKVQEVDWNNVYAIDAETAAEEYAENSDCENDYTIIRNGEAEIWVRDPENNIVVFDITSESVPQYSATERSAHPTTGNTDGQ
jgi:DNA topoisomerase VI subunit B